MRMFMQEHRNTGFLSGTNSPPSEAGIDPMVVMKLTVPILLCNMRI